MSYKGGPGPVSSMTTLVRRDPLIVKLRKLYREWKCQQGHLYCISLHITSWTSMRIQVKV